jgi:hypothetical protein
MNPPVLACSLLPAPEGAMSWRQLEAAAQVGPEAHYLACLRYARQLWEAGLPARALLALDRGLFCDLPSVALERPTYPLPYAVIGWMITQEIGDAFIGNPRAHYQHLAGRVQGSRAPRVRSRAWAAWSIVRAARPDWPGDPQHQVIEPTWAEIEAALNALGGPHEVAPWQQALKAYA